MMTFMPYVSYSYLHWMNIHFQWTNLTGVSYMLMTLCQVSVEQTGNEMIGGRYSFEGKQMSTPRRW